MIPDPKEMKLKMEENQDVAKAIKYTVKSIERAVEEGREYVCISGKYDIQETVAQYFYRKGYRPYPRPVYSGGVVQQGIFITWI